MASLTDRTFQSYRRVRPGRITDDPDKARHPEEYAVAVTSADGTPIVADVPILLQAILLELQRMNVQLASLSGQEVSLSDVA